MIKTREEFRKVGVGVWIAISLPFVFLGFKAGLFFGFAAVAIGIGGIILSNRAFRPRRN